MSVMGSYCKAYAVRELIGFAGFREPPPAPLQPSSQADIVVQGRVDPEAAAEPMPAEPVIEDRYLFLQENLVVTDGIFIDEHIVFDDITDEWRRFCTDVLKFEVPRFDERRIIDGEQGDAPASGSVDPAGTHPPVAV